MATAMRTFLGAFARELPAAAVIGVLVWHYSTPAASAFVCAGEFLVLMALTATCDTLPLRVFLNVVVAYALVAAYVVSVHADLFDPIGVPRYAGEIATYYGASLGVDYAVHRFLLHGKWLARLHRRHDATRADSAADLFNAHPVEVLLAVVLPTIAGHAACRMFGWSSMRSMEAWLPLQNFRLLILHSGFESAFVVDARHHRAHHEDATANYGSTPQLDILLGTYRER
jgi:sterol desaturase/sphingolipid hydroxylase (fatty acid hydroxylase superfamily)